MEYPKISIVTPSFNQGKYLEETILSVINQKYPNLEYIIIDGGSTDNSVNIIKKYEKHLSYWVSEKDKGQSDAINKGMQRSRGDLFNWINSDDLLEEGALLKIAEAYRTNTDKKIFCFGMSLLEEGKKLNFEKKNDSDDPLQLFCDPVINQPSTYYAISYAVRESALLNQELHYAMDYDWMLRFLFSYGRNSVFVSDEKISVFRMHQEAKSAQEGNNFANDIANILFSLAKKSGLENYIGLFRQGYTINEKYTFNSNVTQIDRKLIERMIIYFLLKWSRLVYTKKQHAFAGKILASVDFSSFVLSAKEQQWLNELNANAFPENWVHYRIKRKLNHILSGHK